MVGSTPRARRGKGTERVRAGNGLSARATVNLHGLFPERIETTAVRRGAEKSRAAIVSSEVAKTLRPSGRLPSKDWPRRFAARDRFVWLGDF